MAHSDRSDESSIAFSVPTVPTDGETALRTADADADAATEPKDNLPSQGHDCGDTNLPKKKKSISFKLAFAALALCLLVFQIDGTCLSIALPVS